MKAYKTTVESGGYGSAIQYCLSSMNEVNWLIVNTKMLENLFLKLLIQGKSGQRDLVLLVVHHYNSFPTADNRNAGIDSWRHYNL
ncbi:hypothetical protein [Spirosoma luteum]|uniref:hypothetical protein n=1 Tax=Spirosoma luteum TaxID=431553 RepID=UPI0003670369|nr:hypothetical protein [Spirosoma luteum]